MTDTRQHELRQMLQTRRHEMHNDVQRRLRDGLTAQPAEGHDEVERSDAGYQEELALALLQMRTEAVIRIDEALARLGAGQYGSCVECTADIPERRLRALPFAVRCQACEERRENERRADRRRDVPSFQAVSF